MNFTRLLLVPPSKSFHPLLHVLFERILTEDTGSMASRQGSASRRYAN
jgi:hypothetical protein